MPTSGRVRVLRLTTVLLLLAPLTACQSLVVARLGASAQPSATSPAAMRAASTKDVTQLTALGDSVPYGTECQCIPYPRLTMRDISHIGRHPGTTKNQAVPGYTTDNMLTQIEYYRDVRRDIVHSQAVTVEIGANDVAHSATCGNDVACYERRLPKLRANLERAIYCIRLLTARRPVTLVLLDYWNVWLGGKYAAAHGPEYVNASHQLTAKVSDLIRAVARSSRADWVDLQTAFRGADRTSDETQLLAPDGDHPNAAGHVRISRAIERTIALHA